MARSQGVQKLTTVRLLKHLRPLLRNHTVRFSKASEHHKKLAAQAIPAFGTRVQRLGPCYFRMDSELFARVLSSVSELGEQHRPTEAGLYELMGGEVAGFPFVRSPDDLVAMAVYSAAPIRRSDPKQDIEEELVWDPVQPVIKAWGGVRFWQGKPLGRSLPAHGERILEFAPDGKLRFPKTRFQRPRLKIGWELSVDASQPPALKMRIEGAPLARLYFPAGKLFATLDQRRAALDVLEPAFRVLLKQLGTLRQETHRPKTSNDVDAALLHFHLKLPWKDVAERLCRIDHKHNADCEAKCRQAAKRYYKHAKNRVSLSREF